MVETSGVYATSPVDDEEELAELFRRFAPDGVVGTPDTNDLKVTGNGTNSLSVAGGFGLVGGYWYKNSSARAVPVISNGAGLPRRDRLIVRADPAADSSVPVIKQGTPAASPTAPTLSAGTTGIWEIPLAQFTVAAGASVATSLAEDRWFTAASGPVPGLSTVRHGRMGLGAELYEHDTGRTVQWTGSGWAVTNEPETSINLPGPPAPYNTAWTIIETPTARRMRDGMIQVNFVYQRKGSTFNDADADGSILAEIPSPYRPLVSGYWTVPMSGNNHGYLFVDTGGTMNLRQPMKDMAAGHFVRGNLVYRGA